MIRQETCVYVIAVGLCGEATGLCKIGIAGNPGVRLSGLQTSNHQELILTHFFRLPSREIARTIEKQFHNSHKGYYVRGEWFRIDPAVAAKKLSQQIVEIIESADGLEDWEIRAARGCLIKGSS